MFFKKIEQAAIKFRKINEGTIRIVSHLDADGICACSIMIKTLKRMNKNYSVSIIHQLSEDFLKELSEESYSTYVFTDLGSGQFSLIKKYLKGKKIFILDHHQPSDGKDDNIIHVNPMLYGMDGSKDISGSGVVFLFSRALDKKNDDLAHLAVIGAIGDVQEDKGFSGINKQILEIAIKNKKIKLEKSLRLFGITTRPLHKVLEYSSDPYIPGISGSESNVIQFLHKLDIEPKQGNKWKTFNDLTEDEKKRLVSAIILERVNEENPEDVFGDLYLLTEEDKASPTCEAREFSTLLNSCGRMDKASLGIGVCLNDKKLKEKAIRNLDDYKKEIVKALRWFGENRKSKDVIEKNNFIIINAKGNVLGTIIGTLASILSKSDLKNKYILSMARLDAKSTKISLRYTGDKDIDLKEIISKITEKVDGEAGGHKNAAGALIDKEKEESFIKEAENILKEL